MPEPTSLAIVHRPMRIIAALTGLTAIALAAFLAGPATIVPGTPVKATAPAWVDPPVRVAAVVPVAPPSVAQVPVAGAPQASAAAVPLRVSVKPRAPHRRTIRRAAPKAAPARVQVAGLAPVPEAAPKPRPAASPLVVGPVGDILRGLGALD